MWSDLNAPSSSEWHWMTLPALRVASSPIVDQGLLRHRAAVVEHPAPDPHPQQPPEHGLNGVPLNRQDVPALSFQSRSCHQKYGS